MKTAIGCLSALLGLAVVVAGFVGSAVLVGAWAAWVVLAFRWVTGW